MLINGCVGKCLLMEVRYGLRHGFKKSNLISSVRKALFVTVRIVSGLILGWRCWMIGRRAAFFWPLLNAHVVRVQGRFTSNKWNSLKGQRAQDLCFGGGGKKTKSPTLLNLNFYYVSLFISVRSLRGALIGPLILRLSLNSPAFSKCLNTCFMLYSADVCNFSKKAVGSKIFSSRQYCLVTPVSFLYSENTRSGTSSEGLAAPFHTHSLRWLLLPYGGRPGSHALQGIQECVPYCFFPVREGRLKSCIQSITI